MAEWFRHDIHASRDEKCAELLATQGYFGYGFFWSAIEFLATCKDQRYPKTLLLRQLQDPLEESPKLAKVLQALIDLDLLQIESDKYITSRSLQKRMAAIGAIAEKRKQAAEEKWKKVKGKSIASADASADASALTKPMQKGMRSELIRVELSRLEGAEESELISASPNGSPEHTHTQPELNEDEKIADEFLEQPGSSAEWEKSNQWILAARRPLKKYPDMYFSVSELAEAMRQWAESGIPPQRYRDVLQLINGRIKQYKLDRKSVDNVSAFNWAIGWAKKDVISNLNEETKLEKNRARMQ